MIELRIYYESYEQAVHYILPIFKENCPGIEIKLVHYSNKGKYPPGSLVSNILKFKNPDILITFVDGSKEFPVFLIEFSEAVITEDHELQRFDGMLAAVLGKCFYIKISPKKYSRVAHGGNTSFDTFIPYGLIYKRFKIAAFHFEWPLISAVRVSRDQDFPACPPKIEDLQFLISEVLKTLIKNPELVGKNGVSIPETVKSNNTYLREWLLKLEKFDLKEEHLHLNSSRMRWDTLTKSLIFKFNRMGHAMDPERGMIWFYKYRHDVPIISRIKFPSKDSIFSSFKLRKDFDYLDAFLKGTGLNGSDKFISFLKEKEVLSSLHELQQKEIDITEFLQKNIFTLNKSLFAIFLNSTSLLIQDLNEKTRIGLKWAPVFDLLEFPSNNEVTPLEEAYAFDEDDVTYIVAHNILQKNGFKILSVSYPGAQGDRAILPDVGGGREQIRKYVDIIAVHPERKYLNLNESKGKFNSLQIRSDIVKLSKFKKNSLYKNALETALSHFEIKNDFSLLLSVSFWDNNGVVNLKKIPLDKIDFFISISSDMKSWKVWVGGNSDVLKIREGVINREKIFFIKKM